MVCLSERVSATYYDEHEEWSQKTVTIRDLLDDICDEYTVLPYAQPTIKPERNKGRWVRITQGAVPEKYMCPFCRRTIEDSGVENLLSVRFPFCHCGADMRGEQDG